MKTGGLLAVSLIVAALMAGFAFYTDSILPPGAQLPIHFNAAGEADNFADALSALLIAPGILAGIAILFGVLPRLEPLQDRMQGSAPLLRSAWIGMILLLVLVDVAVAGPAYGLNVGSNMVIAGTGLLLIFIGNMLPKSRPGFFVGIRTPWAILDTDNWIATQRLGGKLMMLAGVAIFAAAFLPLPPEVRVAVVIGSVIVSALPPVVYSWWLWNRKGREHANGA